MTKETAALIGALIMVAMTCGVLYMAAAGVGAQLAISTKARLR